MVISEQYRYIQTRAYNASWFCSVLIYVLHMQSLYWYFFITDALRSQTRCRCVATPHHAGWLETWLFAGYLFFSFLHCSSWSVHWQAFIVFYKNGSWLVDLLTVPLFWTIVTTAAQAEMSRCMAKIRRVYYRSVGYLPRHENILRNLAIGLIFDRFPATTRDSTLLGTRQS